nr:hypothetical protein [uncultured Rhodopila sp.]
MVRITYHAPDWQRGYDDGFDGKPAAPGSPDAPRASGWVCDELAYSSGYIEGKADREKREAGG